MLPHHCHATQAVERNQERQMKQQPPWRRLPNQFAISRTHRGRWRCGDATTSHLDKRHTVTLRSGPSKGCRALAYREDRKDQRHHRGTSDNAIPAIQPGCSAATPASVPCVVPNSPSKPVENVGQCDFEHPSAGSESIRLTPAQSPQGMSDSLLKLLMVSLVKT